MACLTFTTRIAAPLGRIWLFHANPEANFAKLAGEALSVTVEPKPLAEGTAVTLCLTARSGRWACMRVRLTELAPPHAVLFGQEARFSDVQEEGPYAAWMHSRELEATEDGQTLVRDIVSYRLRGGWLGAAVDLLVVRWRLAAWFGAQHHRLQVLMER